MTIEQIYTGCLAQGAYYIESQGEAAIIDPLRESEPYLSRAEADGATIKFIFETHFHADFVSGHVDLAKRTGATIVYGPEAETDFQAHVATDGEEFKVGDLTLRVLHTPGHTVESSCYLLLDAQGQEKAIFTGDTLFLGDVGRPDLAQKGADMTSEDLAGMLYDSLRSKIMPLPDHITVYPAHGAGSACGKNMMKITQDTLGNQKAMNYALQPDLTKEQFTEQLLDGLLAPPAYFPLNVSLNKRGYDSHSDVMKRGTVARSVAEVKQYKQDDHTLLLDVRSAEDFAQSHIPGSIFIGLDGSFAPWVGELIADIHTAILLIAPAGREEEAVKRLARVGFDQCVGYLDGGIEAWKQAGEPVSRVQRYTAKQLEELYRERPKIVVDIRKPSEYDNGHILEVDNLPLSDIHDHLDVYRNMTGPVLHCAGGYRSMIAASILKSRGIENVSDVIGGYGAIKEAVIPVVSAALACD